MSRWTTMAMAWRSLGIDKNWTIPFMAAQRANSTTRRRSHSIATKCRLRYRRTGSSLLAKRLFTGRKRRSRGVSSAIGALDKSRIGLGHGKEDCLEAAFIWHLLFSFQHLRDVAVIVSS